MRALQIFRCSTVCEVTDTRGEIFRRLRLLCERAAARRRALRIQAALGAAAALRLRQSTDAEQRRGRASGGGRDGGGGGGRGAGRAGAAGGRSGRLLRRRRRNAALSAPVRPCVKRGLGVEDAARARLARLGARGMQMHGCVPSTGVTESGLPRFHCTCTPRHGQHVCMALLVQRRTALLSANVPSYCPLGSALVVKGRMDGRGRLAEHLRISTWVCAHQ